MRDVFIFRGRAQRWAVLCLFFLALVLFTGCQTMSYYKQAVTGQCQILANRTPISEILADPKTPESLKHKLRLVQEVREFAHKELNLPIDGHYQKYVDLHRDYVVWNVHAAPEFSLEPKAWWYPVVGTAKYRGYFSEKDAWKYAAGLQRQHLDVYVGGVEAYSTLGWFQDPVLNTFIRHSDTDLAETLFHELAHQRLFVNGDTDFSEAFATSVAQEAMRRWMASKGNAAEYEKYMAENHRTEQFVNLVLGARQKLEVLYGKQATPNGITNETALAAFKREGKAEIFQELRKDYELLKKTEWGGKDDYDRWMAKPMNNARLNTIDAYYRLLPAFQSLITSKGTNVEDFYREVNLLAKVPKEERHRKLAALLAVPNKIAQTDPGQRAIP
ncbi:MAG: aminopeptidase [Verrucomicrobiales bacterium]|nr:aminopeptidase [Verrucomicrobiales bacterium]